MSIDKLDRILRRDAAEEIADAGFSARVMGALPARELRDRPWLKPALVMGSAALGSVLAVLLAPPEANIFRGMADLMHRHAFTPAAFACSAMSVALLASALLLTTDN